MSGITEKFKIALKADGLWAAMRWINDRVPYRFTAIFAFDGDMLRNICLIDKENQNITNCSDQPITESYCMYIRRSRERFSVEEASLDRRVEGHPKRQNVQCYYGIPLFGSKGDDLAPLIAEAAFSASEKDRMAGSHSSTGARV